LRKKCATAKGEKNRWKICRGGWLTQIKKNTRAPPLGRLQIRCGSVSPLSSFKKGADTISIPTERASQEPHTHGRPGPSPFARTRGRGQAPTGAWPPGVLDGRQQRLLKSVKTKRSQTKCNQNNNTTHNNEGNKQHQQCTNSQERVLHSETG